MDWERVRAAVCVLWQNEGRSSQRAECYTCHIAVGPERQEYTVFKLIAQCNRSKAISGV